MNCQRCGGRMLANMDARHQGKDDEYEVACMLCGHDNAPPRPPEKIDRRIAENRERHARKLAEACPAK